MNKLISPTELTRLADNYRENIKLTPFETKGAIISLEALNEFISGAQRLHQANFDAIRIYFVRHKLTTTVAKNHINKVAEGSELSQVSLILAPVKIRNRDQWQMEELNDNGDILTLCVCHPEDIVTENPVQTGLCPPKPSCP